MDAPLLAGWENFYVITGTAAGGLTGLTFVVIALIRDVRSVRPTGLSVFVTPTIVHFGGVLALAAFLSMPHLGRASLSAVFGAGGLAGVVYGGVIAAKMPRRDSVYVPVREDWIWNVIVPTVSYGALLLIALLIWWWPAEALYGVALVSVVLLFTGIRNAWDIAVWMTTRGPGERQ